MKDDSYFDWIARHTRRAPRRRSDETDREEPARPSEPLEVEEFDGASTTIIERVRDAIRKRFTSP